jgi:hypothetical protein
MVAIVESELVAFDTGPEDGSRPMVELSWMIAF